MLWFQTSGGGRDNEPTSESVVVKRIGWECVVFDFIWFGWASGSLGRHFVYLSSKWHKNIMISAISCPKVRFCLSWSYFFNGLSIRQDHEYQELHFLLFRCLWVASAFEWDQTPAKRLRCLVSNAHLHSTRNRETSNLKQRIFKHSSLRLLGSTLW